ncbi:Aldo/keto reductase [Faunimonas pinastri]|uniref:Aldo/keto reductase n=1 Tax=Faunimonas pinastri TaxID=1855383 RepID=A0A1H9KYU9_9HYPH|nr:aldo/keto reductase [Faunimonas pinastri]SER04362.1 Aldo/keto reductase [Faunimonas pinastri]
MRKIDFAGKSVPVLGQGSWKMADRPADRQDEIAAIRRGLDLGMTLIDTAEMYGEGETETLLGEALEGRRDEVFLVSKVYPHNAGRREAVKACERSLRRLGTDRLDLYLLHWPGSIPLEDTVAAFDELMQAGKIGRWGVSNFDVEDMEDLFDAGGEACATNQILYNLTRRGPERDLLPWLSERNIPAMAYSPVEQGRLTRSRALGEIAESRGATPAEIALAWVLRRPDMVAIPKASRIPHVEENRGAADLELTSADLEKLDKAFPAPSSRKALEML